MKLTSVEQGGKLTLGLAGELNYHEARDLSKQIEERIKTATPRDCVLDMGGVTFMDYSSVAVILMAYKHMQALGGRLWIENLPSQSIRVLADSGIDRIITITSLS